jgi:putative motility protein YjfB-like
MASDLAVNPSSVQTGDAVSIRVLRMALDQQQSASAQVTAAMKTPAQPAPGSRLVDVYA